MYYNRSPKPVYMKNICSTTFFSHNCYFVSSLSIFLFLWMVFGGTLRVVREDGTVLQDGLQIRGQIVQDDLDMFA